MSSLPALCESSTPLSPEQTQRFSRHLLLPAFGKKGQQSLLSARVLVIGAGGLGAPVLLYLAAAGIGSGSGCIGLVEFDTVDISNLQRQVLYRQQDVGQSKLDSSAAVLRERHPEINLELHSCRLEASNALALIRQYDLIIDGSDNFSTRFLVNDACVLADKPYVWGSIYRFEGQVSVFWENAPGGRGLNYRDLYPEAPPPEFAPSCAEGGVLGVLCGVIGSLMATEAIKLLSGIGEPLLGQVLTYDALQMRFRKLPLQRAAQRAAITTLSDQAQSCKMPANASQVPQISVQELHAWRQGGREHVLIDVRTNAEREIVLIEGALHLPQEKLLAAARSGQFSPQQTLVLHCKSGARSSAILPALQELGFHQTFNLQGGILAWVREIAPDQASY